MMTKTMVVVVAATTVITRSIINILCIHEVHEHMFMCTMKLLTLSLLSSTLSRLFSIRWYSEIFWPIGILWWLFVDASKSLYLLNAISAHRTPSSFYEQYNFYMLSQIGATVSIH